MAAVGNLGGYQIITTLIKRLGGPKPAAIKAAGAVGFLSLGTGVLGYFIGTKKSEKNEAKEANADSSKLANGSEWLVLSAAVSNDGTAFSSGDRLRVVDTDGDAVMIERVGDKNSPYWVSRGFLMSITDGDIETAPSA